MGRSARSLVVVSCVLAGWAAAAQAQPQGEGTLVVNPHQGYVQGYEGTGTCLACHEEQAKHAFSSIHYQWKAPAPNLANAGAEKIGKINSTNDFCTNPSFQWIAILTNDQKTATGLMVPVQVGPTFRTGNTMASAIGGAKAFRGRELTAKDISYVEVERWMGLFHEVVPKAQALKCEDCHGATGNRLDWKALGYAGDPMKIGGRKLR